MVEILQKYYPIYLSGLKVTLLVSLLGVLAGTLLGTLIGVGRISRCKLISKIIAAYIEFVRGTPLLVQVFIIVYGLPYIGIKTTDLLGCVLALTLNSSAYIAEIIRSGIQSVDSGQMEAARSLGMSYGLSMKSIILPQAIKNILPALGNEFITLIKESAIVSVVGVHDLMYGANTVRGATFDPFGPLLIVAGIYFCITFILSKIVSKIEKGLAYD